jgi:acyl carrier protein
MLEKQYGIKITDSKVARKILFNVRTIAEYVYGNRKI